MAAGVYKMGQGYWVRLMSAIGYGLILMMGAVWAWDLLARVQIGDVEAVYTQAGAAVLVVGIFGWLGYELIGRRPRVVDFLVATEGEMKKVNWSTRREVMAATRVVIILSFIVAILSRVFDVLFAGFFRFIDVLETV